MIREVHGMTRPIVNGTASLVVAVLLGGCPGEQPDPAILARDTPAAPPPAAAVPPDAPRAERIPLQPVDAALGSGEALIVAGPTELRIELGVSTALPNARLPAYLRSGRCDDGGPIVAPLESIDSDPLGDGGSSTIVPLAPHQLLDGQSYIEIQDGGAEPRNPIFCGDLPARPELHPDIRPDPIIGD
jgi:hypothetical protein